MQPILKTAFDILLEDLGPIEGLYSKEWQAIIAARTRNFPLVFKLIDEGAGISAKDENGKTLAMIAAEQGDMAAALELSKRGADVTAKDKNGTTVITYMIAHGCNMEQLQKY